MGASQGGGGIAVRRGGGGRRRRIDGWFGGIEGVVVVLVDGVVELEGRQGVGEALIGWLRRVEAEAELDAGLELVEVLVGHALAPLLQLVPRLPPHPAVVLPP